MIFSFLVYFHSLLKSCFHLCPNLHPLVGLFKSCPGSLFFVHMICSSNTWKVVSYLTQSEFHLCDTLFLILIYTNISFFKSHLESEKTVWCYFFFSFFIYSASWPTGVLFNSGVAFAGRNAFSTTEIPCIVNHYSDLCLSLNRKFRSWGLIMCLVSRNTYRKVESTVPDIKISIKRLY